MDRGYAVADGARLKAFRRLTLERALADISQLLTSRGARPLLLKGSAFARWLYEDPSERPYGDIDLLVAPDRFETAARGLSDLGYEQLDPGRWTCSGFCATAVARSRRRRADLDVDR